MINNYTYFLLESKGISDVVIEYSDYLYNLYKNFKFITIKRDFVNKEFKLKDVNIQFINDPSISSKFYIKNLRTIENDIYGFNFIFSINSTNKKEIKGDFMHELTHAYEFYQLYIKSKPIPFYNIIKQALLNTSLDIEHPFEVFKRYIYLTLDNELNARISQIYPFLVSLQTDDYDILLKELEKSIIYQKYNEIINFDVDRMSKYLIDNLGIENVYELINNLNSEILSQVSKNKSELLKTYEFLNIKIDSVNLLNFYFNQWKRIFKSKSEKHKRKLIEIIDKVIMDYHQKQNYSS